MEFAFYLAFRTNAICVTNELMMHHMCKITANVADLETKDEISAVAVDGMNAMMSNSNAEAYKNIVLKFNALAHKRRLQTKKPD